MKKGQGRIFFNIVHQLSFKDGEAVIEISNTPNMTLKMTPT